MAAAPGGTLEDALALHRQGRLREARRVYEALAAREPRNARLHLLLGVVAHQQGNVKQSARALARAVALEPDNAEHLCALGYAELLQNRLPEAEAALLKALALDPSLADVHANLGDLARARETPANAIPHYRAALDRLPTHARAWYGLGVALGEVGTAAGAVRALAAATAQAPAEKTYADALDAIGGLSSLGWHFDMLADQARNAAYRRAIEAAVAAKGPDAPVLEIGAGSGLLAMMAARAGARRVVACEADPRLADTARTIVAANGLADRVTIVTKRSTELEVGIDLPARTEIVIGEIFDGILLGEDALFSFADAAHRLAAPGAAWVPRQGRIHAAVVEYPKARPRQGAGTVEGFDLSAFDRLAVRRFYAPLGPGEGWRRLTEKVVLFDLDFAAPAPLAGAAQAPVRAIADGRGDAVALWFSLEFGVGAPLGNDPDDGAGHWPRGLVLLPPETAVVDGQTLTLTAEYFRQFVFVDVA